MKQHPFQSPPLPPLPQSEFLKQHPSSWSGERLVPGGALHLGHSLGATRLIGVKMAAQDDGANREALLLATAAGR